MKCPECQRQGLTSRVYPGMSCTTLMCDMSYYDENGDFHAHNPNKTTTDYRCSNGHTWTEVTPPIECWCGWPHPVS